VSGTGIALLMISIKTALDMWWNLAGIFSGGMLGLFLLGILSKKASSTGAAVGTVAGIIVIAWSVFSKSHGAWWSNPLDPLVTIMTGTLTIFIVGMALRMFSVAGEERSDG
jgi:SSS family solute:Na+ symporter